MRDLQKLLKYLNGKTTSVPVAITTYVLLSTGMLPIIFLLYSTDLLAVVL